MKPARRAAVVAGRLVFAAIAATPFIGSTAWATDYYVATTGSDSNPGTLEQPFATLQKGASTAVAGDTVYIRGGRYSITTPTSPSGGIVFSKSGTSDSKRIRYWAYPGELPVFDFANMTISTTGYTMGFSVSGSWLHFKGLEICNVPMNSFSNNGISVDGGGNDIFELLNLHHNSGNGIFIGKGAGGHLVLDCDAHDNFDATSNQGEGQNADGFGVHYQTSGATTVIRGCRAWWNSDDGYDLINQEVPVTVENSWAMGNGYAKYGTYSPSQGNGNGFKMGSSKTGVRHRVQGNVAWKNKASGFYANHSSGGNTWYNNTSYSNGTQFNMLASPPDEPNTTITLTGSLVHIMRNSLGYPNKNTNMTGVDTASNAWDLGLTPAAKDFLSVSDPSVSGTGESIESSGALGPREADGSLPAVAFLKLVAGSQMIDKGVDVGLPFVGAAPDLGAYEFGAMVPDGGTLVGSGGAPGSGGSGAGGAVGRDAAAVVGGAVAGGASGKGGATGSGGAAKRDAGDSAVGSGGRGGSVPAATGGSPASSTSPTATGGAPQIGVGGTTGTKVSSSGCSCSLSSRYRSVALPALLLGVLACLRPRSRRRGRRPAQ